MQDVCYSRLKLGLALILAAPLMWLGVWMMGMPDLKGMLFGGFFAAMMAFLLVYFARYLLDNRIMSVGPAGIEYHGVLSTKRLRFDQIAAAMIETTMVNYIKHRSLIIVPVAGLGGKVKIFERLLEGRVGKLEGLLDLLDEGAAAPPPRRAPSFPIGLSP